MTEAPSNDRTQEINGHKQYWLDDMRNVHKLFWALVVVCAFLFMSDALYEKHVIYEFENWFGFFGLFGFFVSFALVLTARELRKILMRDEDFYDRSVPTWTAANHRRNFSAVHKGEPALGLHARPTAAWHLAIDGVGTGHVWNHVNLWRRADPRAH